MKSGIVTPGYFGGKAGVKGLGRWINAHLPNDYEGMYMEPFGGLFGVGLNRPKSKCEIYNDIDECLVIWFRALRDWPEEFAYRVTHTPRSRSEFERALTRIRDTSIDELSRAVDVHTVIQQSVQRSLSDEGDWSRFLKPGRDRSKTEVTRTSYEMIMKIYERMKNVQLENKDALELLKDVSGIEQSVVYVDPPFMGTTQTYYHKDDGSRRDALTAILLSMKGRIAVSGHGDEWDHLGWRSASKKSKTGSLVGAPKNQAAREEKLWMNYQAEQARMEL